ncbi:MAG: hypothetical protein HY791_02920 [Deltaproteobacteria bacterium]|nr:hypothetical protein [Deltaproteobacteria bacterium]
MAKSRVVVKDKGLSEILQRMKGASKLGITVGVHGDGEIATYAAANEFGTDEIPERSFLRSTMDTRQTDIANVITKTFERVSNGTLTPRQAGAVIGAWVQAAVRKTIQSNVPPPNAPATIAKKGSSHTLIDEGRLRQGITFKVKDGASK